MLETIVELLQANGFELDGQTKTERVKFITKDSYPLAGKLATFGGRLRYVLPGTTQCVTVGKRTVCFYEKIGRETSNFQNFPTNEIESIRSFILSKTAITEANDYTIEAYQWERICEECVEKYDVPQSDLTETEFFHCDVEGCTNEADYRIEFLYRKVKKDKNAVSSQK